MRRAGARPNGGSFRHDDLHLDRRSRPARLRPRAGPLHRVRGPADAPAEVLHRLPAGDRQAHPQGDRVRDRDDPARRLREDPRHAPAGVGRRRSCLRPGDRGGAGARGRGRPAAPRARLGRPRCRPRLARRVRRARRASNSCRSRRSRGSRRASPTSATRSGRMPTGAPAPGSACSSSSRGRPRTSSSRSSSSPGSS